MDLVLEKESIIKLFFEEISGKSVANVHSFLEDVTQTACEHHTSL